MLWRTESWARVGASLDRGVAYRMPITWRTRCANTALLASVSRPAEGDNANCERFFRTLKRGPIRSKTEDMPHGEDLRAKFSIHRRTTTTKKAPFRARYCSPQKNLESGRIWWSAGHSSGIATGLLAAKSQTLPKCGQCPTVTQCRPSRCS